MLKKAMVLLVALLLTLISVFSCAETATEVPEAEVEEFMEDLGESSQTFAIPINVGPIYSIILRRDGVGIAFSMINSKSLSLALEAVSFLTDLKEVEIYLENGNEYTIPAVVQFQHQTFGSFIIINVSGTAAKSIIGIITSGSPMARFTFIQNNNKRTDMTVEEVNEALTNATGKATDVASQAGEAVNVFWQNFSLKVGKFSEDTYAGISNALETVSEFLSNAADGIGDSISDAASSTGEFFGEAMESAGEIFGEAMESADEFFGDAMESAGESIEDAVESIGEFWNGLWGH